MQVNAIITYTKHGDGKKVTATLSDINPEITNAKLRELIMAISQFTEDNFSYAQKVTKDDYII